MKKKTFFLMSNYGYTIDVAEKRILFFAMAYFNQNWNTGGASIIIKGVKE